MTLSNDTITNNLTNVKQLGQTNLKSFERQLSLGTEVLPAATSLVHSDLRNVWTKEASHSQTHV